MDSSQQFFGIGIGVVTTRGSGVRFLSVCHDADQVPLHLSCGIRGGNAVYSEQIFQAALPGVFLAKAQAAKPLSLGS